MSGQLWRPIPGWEGLYEVSNHGLVWSCKKRKGTRGGILKTPPLKSGHLQVNLCRDGVPVHKQVHALVLEAFAGPCPPGMECRHLNGNPADNRWPENLTWGTSGENNLDQVRHGTFRNRNTGKAICDHGHEFTPANTGRWPDGRRYCITCRKRRNRELAARRKAQRAVSYEARLAGRP
jgi:hypothetical protein